MHCANEVIHLGKVGVTCLDDHVNSFAQDVEFAIGDQDTYLDQGVVFEGEAGHLAIDPDDGGIGLIVTHATTLLPAPGFFTFRSSSIHSHATSDYELPTSIPVWQSPKSLLRGQRSQLDA